MPVERFGGKSHSLFGVDLAEQFEQDLRNELPIRLLHFFERLKTAQLAAIVGVDQVIPLGPL